MRKRSGCLIWIVGLMVVVFTIMTAYFLAPLNDKAAAVNSPDKVTVQTEDTTPAGDPSNLQDGHFGYYNLISGEERALYDKVFEKISAGEFSFDLEFNYYNDDRDMLSKCIYLCVYDHPEYFMVSGNVGFQWTGSGPRTSPACQR